MRAGAEQQLATRYLWHFFAPLRPQQFSKFSSRIFVMFSTSFKKIIANNLPVSRRVVLNLDNCCTDLTDYENAARCRKSEEIAKKLGKTMSQKLDEI